MRKNAWLVFLGNVGSKVLGLGREVLAAAFFGTGSAMGAFRVAFAGTSVPMNFLTGDSLNSAFIPLYRRFAADSQDKAQDLLWALLLLFASGSLLIAVGLWLAAATWVDVLAPGLDTETAGIAASMLRVMGVGVPFYLISALLTFLAMANDDFVPMALRPAIQNVGLIAGTAGAVIFGDVLLLAWGFTGSYICLTVWLTARCIKAGALGRPRMFGGAQVREVARPFWETLRPLLILPLLLQGNIVIERIVASLTGLAAVSALDYARFVTETLTLLISVPIAYAGLTRWSGMSAAAIRSHLQTVTALTLVVAVPASAFLIAHPRLLVEVMYARGAFDEESVTVTGDILFGSAIGVWAQVLGYVLVKGLSAQLRSRAVLLVMGLALLANAAFNLLAYRYLGPLALGFGNSIYGFALLVGAGLALAMVRQIFASARMMLLGSAGYLVLAWNLPLPDNLWAKVCVCGLFALGYWAIWIAAIPSLRELAAQVLLRTSKPGTPG